MVETLVRMCDKCHKRLSVTRCKICDADICKICEKDVRLSINAHLTSVRIITIPSCKMCFLKHSNMYGYVLRKEEAKDEYLSTTLYDIEKQYLSMIKKVLIMESIEEGK